jgi:simple sugar transport system substrate-binding protein
MESEGGGDDGRLIPTTIDAIFGKGWTRASEEDDMDRFKHLVATGVVGSLLIAGLSGVVVAQDEAAQCAAPKANIAVVTHGEATSTFWTVVQKGVEQAEKDLCVDVTYTGLETFDTIRMAQNIDGAVATAPDGLVVSIPDPDALGASIRAAVDAGIPVVSMNSGAGVWHELGIRTHVGSDESVAGLAGGQRLGALGATNVICINDEVGNIALDQRCDGFAKGLAETGGSLTVLPAATGDPIGLQNAVAAALQADPSIDGLVAQGPDTAAPALKALKEANALPQVKMATFDLGPDTLKSIQDGDILFAIDQQQFLQGYLPIVFLMLNKEYQLMPGGGQPVLSGPNFVTKDNAAEVMTLSEQGIR